jgi:hypothetical protein
MYYKLFRFVNSAARCNILSPFGLLWNLFLRQTQFIYYHSNLVVFIVQLSKNYQLWSCFYYTDLFISHFLKAFDIEFWRISNYIEKGLFFTIFSSNSLVTRLTNFYNVHILKIFFNLEINPIGGGMAELVAWLLSNSRVHGLNLRVTDFSAHGNCRTEL